MMTHANTNDGTVLIQRTQLVSVKDSDVGQIIKTILQHQLGGVT